MRSKLLSAVGIATVAVAVAAGCSGKSSGASNKVTGTIGGTTYTPKSGSFGFLPEGAEGSVSLGITSTDPDFCANATTNTLKANSQLMLLLIGNAVNSTTLTPASSTGPYTVYDLVGGAALPPSFIAGEYVAFDSSCNGTTYVYLTTSGSPTMNVTKVSTSALDGKGTGVGLDSGETIDLSFALKSCPGVTTIFTASSNGCLH